MTLEAVKPSDFWQRIDEPLSLAAGQSPSDHYPAQLPDGQLLLLPIRALADGRHGLASLIVNQASFAVLDALAGHLAGRLAAFEPEVVVGLPTLGLTLASAVAQKLGHSRYVPLGVSRKFWYRDELSVPLSSITSPDHHKRLYADPRMLPLLAGRRVAVVDDVISSGASMTAAIRLMASCDVDPVVLGAAMLQSDRWREPLYRLGPQWPGRTVCVFETPLLSRTSDERWLPAAATHDG